MLEQEWYELVALEYIWLITSPCHLLGYVRLSIVKMSALNESSVLYLRFLFLSVLIGVFYNFSVVFGSLKIVYSCVYSNYRTSVICLLAWLACVGVHKAL